MMPYYDDTTYTFLVNNVPVVMTEEDAERVQARNPSADVQREVEYTEPLPDEAADDYLDCTCPDDPPTNMTATLCANCRAYFKSLED